MLKLMTAKKPGYKAESSFGTFASRDLAKMLNNKVSRKYVFQENFNISPLCSSRFLYIKFQFSQDLTLFGKVDMSGNIKPTDEGIPILTSRQGALEIHNKIVC